MLALTGIGPADLRERAGDPDLLAAVLRFLENHEPDLVDIAQTIGVKPSDLVAAREALELDWLAMSRPLLISDCDEVLLHMVAHFADWLDEAHRRPFRPSKAAISPAR